MVVTKPPVHRGNPRKTGVFDLWKSAKVELRFGQGLALWIVAWLLALVPPAAWSQDVVAWGDEYQDRYQRLTEKDVEGRLDLAQWCQSHQLFEQQALVLTEVLQLEPEHPAYRELLAADARRLRPVDGPWAAKLENLMGPGYRLRHTPHFSILSNADAASERSLGETMESAYALFYREVSGIGLRPMPPPGRLVCILFQRQEEYRDYLRKYEGASVAWTQGHYSWRTNRAAYFHDRDNPAFEQIKAEINKVREKIADLKAELDAASNVGRRLQIQEQINKWNAANADMTMRLDIAAQMATLSKSRHEATHQLFFNSGLLRRDRPYPFWLGEGLATVFETCDAVGRAGPKFVNTYRLKTCREAEKNGELLSLRRLLEEKPKDDEDPERVVNRYAQAWAMVYFLWNKRPAELGDFMQAVGKTTPRDWMDLFQEHFGNNLDSLERELQVFMTTLTP
jgi:hypothetical protein